MYLCTVIVTVGLVFYFISYIATGFLSGWEGDFMQIDSCVDNGGIWNADTENCVFSG
jgi:hypothetical protein